MLADCVTRLDTRDPNALVAIATLF